MSIKDKLPLRLLIMMGIMIRIRQLELIFSLTQRLNMLNVIYALW